MKRTGPILFLLSLGYFAALAPYGLNLDDEGTLIYQIYRTFEGQRLYVDFHAGYTPGIFQWNAALYSLLGVNVLWIRLCLAVLNATSVYCLYWLARQLGAARGAAACAGLVYLALIPFYDGQFAAFNIPYPIWYVTLFWLLSVASVIRAWHDSRLWWLAAGICSGIVFSFKPNSGLLNLAGLLIALCIEHPAPAVAKEAAPPAARAAGRRFVSRFLRWFTPVSLVIALTMLFARGAGSGQREMTIFALPLIIVVVVALFRNFRQGPPEGLFGNMAWLGFGFATVIAPWVLWCLNELGTAGLLRSILFIGTNFDRFYFLPYPVLGGWELSVVVVFAGIWLVGLALQRRYLPRVPFLIVTGIAGIWVLYGLVSNPPPMVEGFQSSVVSRVRQLSFGFMLLVEWTAIAAWLRGRATAREPRFFLVLVSAILMHMQLYPRTDFMHLVPACPLLLVLGAWLLDRLSRLWTRALTVSYTRRGVVRAAIVSPVLVLVLIFVGPALARIEYLARAVVRGNAATSALVHLDSPRAPLVIEPAAGKLFLALGETSRFLQANSEPGEPVFTFPALDLVCFLADRPNPTRHGYFYPGWPGHEVEAEVIGDLGRKPPRFVVSLHAHTLFFSAAPLYYFNLGAWVSEGYAPVARFGIFDVLAPNGVALPVAAPTLFDDVDLWERELTLTYGDAAERLHTALRGLAADDPQVIAAALRSLDPDAQKLAAGLVRKSRSPQGAAALAHVLGDRNLAPPVHELFVRAISEVGELSAAPALLDAMGDTNPYRRAAVVADLYGIVSRRSLAGFWWVPPNSDEDQLERLRERIHAAQLVQWIEDPWASLPMRAFAVHISGMLGVREAAPFLMKVAANGDENPSLRTDAVHSLFRLGMAAPLLPMIVQRFGEETFVAPALAVRLYPSAPDLGYPPLAAAMRSFNETERMTAYWVATAVADPRLDELLRRGAEDSNEQVRLASQFATEDP